MKIKMDWDNKIPFYETASILKKLWVASARNLRFNEPNRLKETREAAEAAGIPNDVLSQTMIAGLKGIPVTLVGNVAGESVEYRAC